MLQKYTPEFLVRFWSKIDCSAGLFECWIWTAHKNRGYGMVWHDNRDQYAHRVSYELAYGSFPDEMQVLHKCDNPPCQNPLHLFLGTRFDNMQDRENKGRGNHASGEKNVLCKLSDAQVADIRQKYAIGNISQRQLGRIFGVSQRQILRIVNNESRAKS